MGFHEPCRGWSLRDGTAKVAAPFGGISRRHCVSGRRTAGVRPVGSIDPAATRVVEVVARLRPRSRASLVLRRAAYVR